MVPNLYLSPLSEKLSMETGQTPIGSVMNPLTLPCRKQEKCRCLAPGEVFPAISSSRFFRATFRSHPKTTCVSECCPDIKAVQCTSTSRLELGVFLNGGSHQGGSLATQVETSLNCLDGRTVKRWDDSWTLRMLILIFQSRQLARSFCFCLLFTGRI